MTISQLTSFYEDAIDRLTADFGRACAQRDRALAERDRAMADVSQFAYEAKRMEATFECCKVGLADLRKERDGAMAEAEKLRKELASLVQADTPGGGPR